MTHLKLFIQAKLDKEKKGKGKRKTLKGSFASALHEELG